MTQHISNQNQNYKYCLVVKTEKPWLKRCYMQQYLRDFFFSNLKFAKICGFLILLKTMQLPQ